MFILKVKMFFSFIFLDLSLSASFLFQVRGEVFIFFKSDLAFKHQIVIIFNMINFMHVVGAAIKRKER